MLIQIEYDDNKFDFVKNDQLDNLLKKHRIHRFKRGSGWVTVGVDPIRTKRNGLDFYYSTERRKVVSGS